MFTNLVHYDLIYISHVFLQ